MLFYSTNMQAPKVRLDGALLAGQAPDRGLYMPETVPLLSAARLDSFRDRPYPEIAAAVLSLYTEGIFPPESVLSMCREAYPFAVPIEKADGQRWILRLDRGPTASFKDFAARMMALLFGQLRRNDDRELVILTATSGDTGSAVASAFHGIPNMRVMILFPPAEVSSRQRRQMTTLGGNVTVVAVDGKFDDCQALVKKAFSDETLRRIRLTSANSINIGRLLPQIVYYVYAYVKTAKHGEPMIVSIPSGNFGNMMGALLAMRMGIPLSKIVIATNANDEVPVFLETGKYRKIVPSRVCISNAMNVGHPSNLARVINLYGGHMDETGKVHQEPNLGAMRRDLFAVSIGEAETRETIRKAWQDQRLLLEPHGAVGWAGLSRYLETENTDFPAVSVETAHPAKFPEEIRDILGMEPDIPQSLQGIEDRDEYMLNIENRYDAFQELLIRTYAS